MRGPMKYFLMRFGKPIACLLASPGLSRCDVLGEFQDVNPRGVVVRYGWFMF